MTRVGEEFPLECPNCDGDIRLIAFITEPGPIRKILTHISEPLEPLPVSPARGPPIGWAKLASIRCLRPADFIRRTLGPGVAPKSPGREPGASSIFFAPDSH
jgi:hypothetical protein